MENNQPIQLLIVDDEVHFLKSTKQLLEIQGGFNVELALSVDDALQKIENKTFDAVVSDYQMPEKTGLDLLGKLREEENNIPFILFTGKGREEVAVKALNLGADRYFNKNGLPEAVYGELAHGIRQIVELRKAEKALRRSEEKYRTIVELSPDGIVSVNAKGIVTSVNRAILERTGFSEKDFLGKHFTQIAATQKEPPPSYKKVIYAFLNGEFPESFEFNYTCKDGTQRSSDARIGLLKQKDELVGLQVIFRDITERKQMEQALKDSEEKYRTTVEQAPDSIITFDMNGVVTSCNIASTSVTGQPADDVVGEHFSELISRINANSEEILTKFKSLLKLQVPEPFEISYVNKNGDYVFGEVHTSFLKEGDKITGFQVVMRDITKNKMAEKALRESEEYWSYKERVPFFV